MVLPRAFLLYGLEQSILIVPGPLPGAFSGSRFTSPCIHELSTYLVTDTATCVCSLHNDRIVGRLAVVR